MRTIFALLVLAVSAIASEVYVAVKGQVKWAGAAAPAIAPIDVRAAFLPPGAPPLAPTDVLVDPKSLGLKNVVVWLRPDTENRKDLFPPEKIKADLRKPKSVHHTIKMPAFQFEPRVVVARANDTLEFENNGGVAHNVNYSSDVETINPLLARGIAVKLKNPLAVQTTPIVFKNDIYAWMGGRVRVFDHPYFAITDQDGNFEIKDAPAGKWRLVYWHENGFHKGREGILGFPIEIKADEPKGKTIELKAVEFVFPK